MDLTEAMRVATDDAPPTRIDVDALIAGERRRSLRLHRLTAAGVTVAALAGTLTLPQAASPPPPLPCPSQTLGPSFVFDDPPLVPVTEECGAAAARLSRVLTTVVTRELAWLEVGPLPATVTKDPFQEVGYYASLRVGASANILVRIYASPQSVAQFRAQMEKVCPGPEEIPNDCSVAGTGDAALFVTRNHHPGGARSGYDVRVVRADGTAIRVSGSGTDLEEIPPPFGEAEIVAIATAPELTLYP